MYPISNVYLIPAVEGMIEILAAFRSHDMVTDIFTCGLLELKEVPWLAASPDAVAIIKNPNGNKVLATVEVKTRVSAQCIAAAEQIAECFNNKVIVCGIDHDDIEEVMDKEQAMQIMIQMSTMNLCYAVYLVGQLGTSNTTGCIIYTVVIYASDAKMEQFWSTLVDKFDHVLQQFLLIL